MHEVIAQRSRELFVKNLFILQHHFAMLDMETYGYIFKMYKVKKFFNKFPKISGKMRINFRKYPNSQPYSEDIRVKKNRHTHTHLQTQKYTETNR